MIWTPGPVTGRLERAVNASSSGGAGLGVGGGEALDLRVELGYLVVEGFDLLLAVSHEGGQVGGGRGILAFVERGDGKKGVREATVTARTPAMWRTLRGRIFPPPVALRFGHFPRPRLR